MNPFILSHYVSPEYFCDREKETKELSEHVLNLRNIAFFAQRRIGKSALILHTLFLLRKKRINCIYLDIYATQNIREFTNQLANGIYKEFPENKSIGKRFWESIKLLRPVISVDEMTGSPELTLDITQPRQFEKTIPQLLQFLDRQKVKTVIAIDEFQQILHYPEKNVEALLRTAIQPLKHVNFIFCGSDQKMIHHIFNNAKRPFYASTSNLNLKKINPAEYSRFIKRQFEKNKIKISDDALESILILTGSHTYYTQRLCHELFSLNRNISNDVVLQVMNGLLQENESIYFQYRSLLTAAQWNMLKAIAIEEKVEQPYNQKFIHRHALGTPSNVKRSIESLIAKEMIYYDNSIEFPYYEVQDKFLMRWMQQKLT